MSRILGADGHLDGNGVEDGGHHLAGHRALPDQRIQLVLVVVERAFDFIRDVGHRRWAHRFVGLLRILRFVLEGARLIRDILLAVTFRDHVANLGDGNVGQRHRVGTHVGNQADLAFARQLDTFIELLRNAHRALRVEAELTRRFLLQG